MIPGGVDWSLDEQTVAELVSQQFPGLAASEVRRLASGWDHHLFVVNGVWVFRFPRRPARIPWLTREMAVMAVVGEQLRDLAPRFSHFGKPTEMFPAPFVGYRLLAGKPVDECTLQDTDPLAADLADVLTRLHGIDPGVIPAPPEGWEAESRQELLAELTGVAETVWRLLDEELRRRCEPYLRGEIHQPAYNGPRRVIHNDICPDHVLVDPHTGRLTGLVDFTDLAVGDPVIDLVGLIGVGDRGFIEHVTSRYGLPLDEGYVDRLTWLTRVLTLIWLGEAANVEPAEMGSPGDLDKHLLWVRRSFL